MTKDKYNELKKKIDKLGRDVKDGTTNSAQYVFEEFKKIWAETMKDCPLSVNIPQRSVLPDFEDTSNTLIDHITFPD